MGISIITPHFNDFEGLKRIHDCLLNQNSYSWEWIIVDDFSHNHVRKSLNIFFKNNFKENIKVIFNDKKTNGSVCRNIGSDEAIFEKLVFLDSDDIITEEFVSNRLIEVKEFTVFKNYNILDEQGNSIRAFDISENYIDYFLQAKFIWQTTTILWDKSFFDKIGKFDPNLKRLQDVELSIRALLKGVHYKIIENKIDFFYCVLPIDIKKRSVKLICESVNYLITNFHNNYRLNSYQKSLVKGYYFMCIRYLCKSNLKKDINYVNNSLKLLYSMNYLSWLGYFRALIFLKFYRFNLIPVDLFMKLNRYFYK